MKIKANRKKILIYSIAIPASVAVVTGVTVGGYFVSYQSNPYLNYAKAPINTSVDAYKAVYYSYLINNSNLLVLPGFSLAESMTQSLLEPKYNDAAFLLIDSEYSGKSTSQVAGASFRSDEGSFVTGVAIAQYLNTYKEYFTALDGDNKKLTWATYGGNSFSSVSSFMVGMQIGIAWFNTNVVPKKQGYLPVEQVFLGNNKGDSYSMGFGPNDGDTLLDRFLNTRTNVDCIVPVAGPQALSAASKIVAKNARTIVVGVDSAIENDPVIKTKKLPNGSGMPQDGQIAVFSSFKNVGLMTHQILRNLQAGKSYANATQDIGGLGYQSLGTLSNSCVGVSQPGEQYFTEAIKTCFDDNTITSYKRAINKLKLIDTFTKLNTDEYRKFVVDTNGGENVSTITLDKYNSMISTIDKDWQKYDQLPNNGFVLEQMPETIPSDLTKNFTQSDWDYKRNTPNRVKELLDPKSKGFMNEVKLTLSTPTSVLLDASFSQSCYDGIAAFYNSSSTKTEKFKLPYTNTTEALIKIINNLDKIDSIKPPRILLTSPIRNYRKI